MPNISPRIFGAAVFGGLIAALVMGSVILFIRGDGIARIEVLLPSPEQVDTITDNKGVAPFDTPGTTGEMTVHLSGAVRVPGVYTLPTGARLSDAIEAAGGKTFNAADGGINLAQLIQDGEQYHVPKLGEGPPSAENQPAGPADAGYCDGLIDLNTASRDLLETLPGIGEGRADDILTYRKENGPFNAVAELTDITGIGQATYEKVLEFVTVCGQK